MEEIWKDIKDYAGLYQVSNFGRVKSLGSIVKCRNGGLRKVKGRILKHALDRDGYCIVILYKDTKPVCKKIHRLVTEAFLDNPNNYPQVNHINCIKTDNNVSNLEWCTISENSKHAHKSGRFDNIKHLKGIESPHAVFTENEIIEIRNLKSKLKGTEIAKLYNVSVSAIYHILHNRSWKHVK